MAITINYENKSRRRITICDLEKGDIFIYDRTPYMLLNNGGDYGYYYIDKDDNDGGRYECEYIAVDLSQGVLREFEGAEEIGVIEKELTIKVDLKEIREWT
jgi:hypothetical protein